MNDYNTSIEMSEKIDCRDLNGVLSLIEKAKTQCPNSQAAMAVVGYGVHYADEAKQEFILKTFEMCPLVKDASLRLAKINSNLRIKDSRKAFGELIVNNQEMSSNKKLAAVMATVYYTDDSEAQSIFLRAIELLPV